MFFTFLPFSVGCTYACIGQNDIHQKGGTVLAVQIAHLHVLDEKTPVDPVGVRVVPGKPQGNKMRDEVVVVRDFRPWFGRHLEEWNIREPLRTKDYAARPFFRLLHFMDLLACVFQFWCAFRVSELVFDTEPDLFQRRVAADQVEQHGDTAVTAFAQSADELNEQVSILFQAIQLPLQNPLAASVFVLVENTFGFMLNAVPAGFSFTLTNSVRKAKFISPGTGKVRIVPLFSVICMANKPGKPFPSGVNGRPRSTLLPCWKTEQGQ